MNKDAKRIVSHSRGLIDTLKCRIRYAKSPFDGDTLAKKAISELRKEGVSIVYDKTNCRYYNPATVSKRWNY